MGRKHLLGGTSLLSLLLLLSACGGNEPGPASDEKSDKTPLFNIGGTVSGLGAGQTLTLLNQGADPLTLNEGSAEFVFPTGLAPGSTYEVSVDAQPSAQSCTVSNGAGTVQDDHVKNVQVSCVNTFTIGGSVTGLAPGQQLTLLINGTDPVTVEGADGPFTFPVALATGSIYNVSVGQHPSGQVCSVTHPEGEDIAENVAAVAVACQAAPLPAKGLRLSWQDEFNHKALNQQVWSIAQTRRDNALRSVQSVNLVDGYLDLRVFSQPNKTTHHSGFIQTQNKFDFKYGYIEAKVRFKSRPGQWSAFWLMSPGAHIVHDPQNPALGTEIDIIEHRSQDSTNKNIENSFLTNIHWNGYGSAHQSYGSGLKALPAGQRFAEWKVLGLLWTPTTYTFYLDNKAYFSSTRAISQSDQFIMLTNEVRTNSWAGAMPADGYGEFGSDLNAWMQVDWVRLWQE